MKANILPNRPELQLAAFTVAPLEEARRALV